VLLTVYNLRGEKVASLIDDELSAGYYEAMWGASNLVSGVFFDRLTVGEFVRARKMALLK